MVKRFLSRWLPFIAYSILIVWLSLTPAPPTIDDALFGWDKFQHAAAYGVLALLAFRAFGGAVLSAKQRWLQAAAVSFSLGGLLEVAQWAFTKTRTAEFSDLLADLLGVGGAYLVAGIYRFFIMPSEKINRS